MTLPPRRLPPALLQVDAILSRLDGAAAADELARYLTDEFPMIGALAFYEVAPPPARFLGGDPPDGRERDDLPPCAREAAASGATAADPATQEIAVAVRRDGRVFGALVARPSAAPFDAVDLRFFAEVARRVGSAPGPRPLST